MGPSEGEEGVPPLPPRPGASCVPCLSTLDVFSLELSCRIVVPFRGWICFKFSSIDYLTTYSRLTGPEEGVCPTAVVLPPRQIPKSKTTHTSNITKGTRQYVVMTARLLPPSLLFGSVLCRPRHPRHDGRRRRLFWP